MRACASSTSVCENAFSKIKAASACQYGISDGFLCENQCRQALSALFIENAFAVFRHQANRVCASASRCSALCSQACSCG